MPLIAIAGAGLALGLGGATAIGAVVAGTATLAATLTAVATVGAVVGAVGAVTGDKTLSTVGMALGAVGGIGSLAANAGLFGESATTASLFGSSTESVQAADIAGEVQGISSGDLAQWAANPILPGQTAADAVAGTFGGSALDAAGGFNSSNFLPTSGLNDTTAATTGDAGGIINQGGGGGGGIKSIVSENVDPSTNTLVKGEGGGLPTSGDSLPAVGPAATAPQPVFPANPKPGDSWVGANGSTYSYDGKAWSQDGGFFSSIMKSPMAQYGAIQAAGSLVGGMFDPLKPAQVEALNAQAAANRAATSLSLQQQANMNAPLPVASRAAAPAVTGAPGGLINQPANTNTVTGQVAV